MTENTCKTKEHYDKKYLDKQHQQLQTSITQTHNHIKSLEQQTKKVCTKIIADVKSDNRILDQKITEINNDTSKIKNHYDNFEVILRKLSHKIGRFMFLFYEVPDPEYVLEDGDHIHTLQDFFGELCSWRRDFFDFDDYIHFKHLPSTSFTK